MGKNAYRAEVQADLGYRLVEQDNLLFQLTHLRAGLKGKGFATYTSPTEVASSSTTIPCPFNVFGSSTADMMTWFRNNEDPTHRTDEKFLKYLIDCLLQGEVDQSLLQQSSLEILSHDSSEQWDGSQVTRYYWLRTPWIKDRGGIVNLPPIQRAAPGFNQVSHCFQVHATSQSNLVNIIKEGKLRPSRLHFSDSQTGIQVRRRQNYTALASGTHSTWRMR